MWLPEGHPKMSIETLKGSVSHNTNSWSLEHQGERGVTAKIENVAYKEKVYVYI